MASNANRERSRFSVRPLLTRRMASWLVMAATLALVVWLNASLRIEYSVFGGAEGPYEYYGHRGWPIVFERFTVSRATRSETSHTFHEIRLALDILLAIATTVSLGQLVEQGHLRLPRWQFSLRSLLLMVMVAAVITVIRPTLVDTSAAELVYALTCAAVIAVSAPWWRSSRPLLLAVMVTSVLMSQLPRLRGGYGALASMVILGTTLFFVLASPMPRRT